MSTRDGGILAGVLPWPLQPLSACSREAGPHCSQTILQGRPGAALRGTGACGQGGQPGEVGGASLGYWGLLMDQADGKPRACSTGGLA